jgi:GGDEF domain-containing protein
MACQPEISALLVRVQKVLGYTVAIAVGAYLGSGPAGEVLVDLWNVANVAWQERRAAQSAGGTTLLLVAGFLLGQGLFLFVKRWWSTSEQRRVHDAEWLATWDRSLSVATRFGLHRYLEVCSEWTAEDPTTRIPSLALFKIKGVGALNDARGTLVGTELLRIFAVELRSASLPDSAGRLSHWMARYRPRLQHLRQHSTPPPRFAARWSGATFALAFRELDAMQAAAVTRELCAWMRRELAAIDGNANLQIKAGLAVGTPNIQPRELATAALKALDSANGNTILTVAHDPTDLRAPALAQMADVAPLAHPMHSGSVESPQFAANVPTFRSRAEGWLKNWGAAAGCVVAALVALQLGGGKTVPQVYFPWPDSVTEFPTVDAAGPRTVRLNRTALPDGASAGFRISDVRITQGEPEEKRYSAAQVRLTVENTSNRRHYVSFYDFQAVDAKQQQIPLEPERMVRVSGGIVGRWMAPGEKWTGGIFFRRKDAPIVGIEFQPDRFNHILVRKDD